MNKYEFQVEDPDALERLDRFLARRLDGVVSREKIKKCILDGLVNVNGQPCPSPKRGVLAGETVSVSLPEPAPAAQAEDGELEIIHEDEDLAVLVKPHGLSVHPSPGEPGGTLVNRLLARFPSLRGLDGERPGIVHRLDKDTTGLLLVALNEPTRLELSAAFAEREVGKEYLALVYGAPNPAQGRIDAPIGRDSRNKTKMAAHERARPSLENGAREARSDYRTLYADPAGRFALLAVNIHSGRTHQIRVHLTHIGHPIIGDKIYTDEAAVKKALAPRGLPPELRAFLPGLADHQLLHAWRLHFTHPARPEGEGMRFCAPPPPEFFSAARALSDRLMRVVLTGNPACGKSSVLEILKTRGIPVWSADAAVAGQYKAGADAWRLIRAQYGWRFLPPDHNGEPGDIDKRALFRAMHDDDGLRRSIESIVHPIVIGQMLTFWEALDALPLGTPLAVAEVPLYLEGGADAAMNSRGAPFPGRAAGFAPGRPLLVGVHCPFEPRAERLRKTRAWPDSMIEKMESWQWPEEKKMAACDLIIDNSGSPEALADSVDKALERLAALRREHSENITKILDELTSCANL